MDCSTPGFPALQHLLEPGEAHASTHVHWMGDAVLSSAVSWSCLHKGFPKESAFHIKWPNTGAIASASFVFWRYKCCKVYKNGKYFISIALLHWKIFGVHIRYIKIRRTMARERLTIKQSSPKILPMNILGWFPLGLTDLISLVSKELSRVFSSTTVSNCYWIRWVGHCVGLVMEKWLNLNIKDSMKTHIIETYHWFSSW